MASNIPAPATTDAAPAPRKKRGLFGFLFKSALGCTAFAIGALIVLVLLLPTMLSGVAARVAHTKFGEEFQGSLEIVDAHLAWFGPEKLSGVVVRDPQKNAVARATLELPSLWSLLRSGGTRIGRVVVDVDADLVQDDSGVTNLERALAPRQKSEPSTTSHETRSGPSMTERLAQLELDLQLRSSHLTWSDVETRRVGTPFEVRDLDAAVKARPGAPIDVHAAARVVSEQPGSLDVDAHVGPIAPDSAWPWGKVDAQARVAGFSTAMIDGVAGLHGNLKEVLGNRFTLQVKASGTTADDGDVDLVLDGELGSIAMHGRLAGGVLRSRAQAGATNEPGLLVTIPPPRGFLQSFVAPLLPAGSSLAIDAAQEPWTMRAQSFALPLPASSKLDKAALLHTLAQAELDLSAAVPSRIVLTNTATQAAHTVAALHAARIDVKLTPGSAAVVHLEAAVEPGTPGTLSVDVSAEDPWTKLAAGTLPVVDAHVIAKGISTAAIGAVAGAPEHVVAGIGRTLDASFDVTKASLDAGTLHVKVTGRDEADVLVLEGGASVAGGLVRVEPTDALRLRWHPPAEWLQREITAALPSGTQVTPAGGADVLSIEASNVVLPLPAPGVDLLTSLRKSATADVKVHVSGATFADATLSAAHTNVVIQAIEVGAHLGAGGQASANAHADLQQAGNKSALVAEVSTADVWALAGPQGSPLPPVDARVGIDRLPVALVDAIIQKDGLAARVLGDQLSLTIEAHGASLDAGTLNVAVTAPNASAALAGHLEKGTFKIAGNDELRISAKIPAALVSTGTKDLLPAETRVAWPQGVADVSVSAREVAVPVPAFGGAQPFELATTLAATSAHVTARLAGVDVENDATRAAKIHPGVRDLALDALLAPGAPLKLNVAAQLAPGKNARLALDAQITEPFATLKGAPLKPVDAQVQVTGLDTATLDALAGRDGLLAGLLGPALDVTVAARGASTSGGSLSMSAKSETLTLQGSARIEKNTLLCTGNEGLDVAIAPRAGALDGYVKSALPAGTRLQLAPDAKPISVKLRNVSVPLASVPASAGSASGLPPKSSVAPGGALAAAPPSALDRLSKMTFTLNANVPALVYSDASTDSAQHPITVRDLALATSLEPGKLPYLTLSGKVEGDPPGQISADVRALDPLASLAQGLDTWRAKVDVHATGVPTAIVDIVAGQGGLLVEALGARVDATLQAPEISMTKGAFVADMRSDLHNIHAEGHLADRSVVIDKQDGLLAQVGLGPLMSSKVVGKLVPTLVDVEKPQGSAPARFAVDALHFPLDGDLRKLDGTVRIDLGEITFGLGSLQQGLPGKLAAALGQALPPGKWTVPSIVVPIQKGVAGYQRLPVNIGGHEYQFSGTYDLVTDVAQLSAEIPVKLLGKKVSAELERVREYVDPDITVPLSIRGSIRNPSIGLDNGALEKVLKKAAEKALGKGLGGLLDDLKKKKKKD